MDEQTCPKCGFNRDPKSTECPKCGIIFEKYEQIQKRKQQPQVSMGTQKKNLTRCSDCGGTISKKAESCPHCGAMGPKTPKAPPKKSTSIATGCLGLIIIFFVLVMISSLFNGSSQNKNNKSRQPEITEAEKARQKAEKKRLKAEEYERCKKNLQCWGDKHSLRATYAGQDFIEKFAKYDFEWTDGMLGSKVSSFRWLDKNKSTLSYFGDKIKFQNGFGAWQNMIYQIDYDPINKRLLNATVKPGRL